jgi:cullin-4
VERKTVVGLLQLIEAERSSEAVDRVLIAHLLRCFTSLGIYATAFQTPFLQQTNEFYAAEGLRCMSSMEVAEYLLHAEVREAPSGGLLDFRGVWKRGDDVPGA